MSSTSDISSQFEDFLRDNRFNLLEKNIFFDTEFSQLFGIFEHLNEVMTSIRKRIERKEELQISSSKFSYMTLKKEKYQNPELVYNFCCDGDVCRVHRVRKEYFVFCTWKPTDSVRMNYRNVPNTYGSFDTLDKAVDFFHLVVKDYLEYRLNVLF